MKALIVTNSSFIKRNFTNYCKKKKIKFFSLKDIDFNSKKIIKKIKKINPNFVIIKTGMSGGIQFNIKHSLDILNYNTVTFAKIINCLHAASIKNVYFVSASCIYPKIEKRQIKEIDLLTGKFEETSMSFSLSNLLAYGMCKEINKNKLFNYINVVPATLYGPYYSKNQSDEHVLTAMLNKFSKNDLIITHYGDGKSKREFLYIYDLFDSIYYMYKKKIKKELINVGTGRDYSIKNLNKIIMNLFKYKGKIIWDKTRPNGVRRKILNCNFLKKKGWSANYDLVDGLKEVLKKP